jgi:hypothetical protein
LLFTLVFHDTWLYHDKTLIINDTFQLFGADAKQVADFVWKALEVPDVNDRNNKFDVSHAFATDLLFGHLYTTTVTNNALVTDPLVLSTSTFVVFYWTKNLFTEQTITFRLVGSVVDGLESGDAMLMVIFEKEDFGRLSLLIAIIRYLFYNVLVPL